MFDNGFEFKIYFTPLQNDFDIKFFLTTINNPQANTLVERVYQVILNMLVTKYLDNKFFDYIYQWGEILTYIAWSIRNYYHCTIGSTTGQAVFGRDMILNIATVIDWQVITANEHQQVDIDNVQENARRFMHEYTVGNLVYVEMNGI